MAVLRNKKGFTRKRDWVQWKRQWIPGINIIGCDFRGVTFTGEVEKLFEIMGVIREC